MFNCLLIIYSKISVAFDSKDYLRELTYSVLLRWHFQLDSNKSYDQCVEVEIDAAETAEEMRLFRVKSFRTEGGEVK